MLGPLGQRPVFAEILLNLAVAIWDYHGGVVPDSEEELGKLPGINFNAIQLVLRHGFDRNLVSNNAYWISSGVFVLILFWCDKENHC